MTDRTCTAPDCERRQVGRGYCDTHYRRLRRTGSVDDPVKAPPRLCTVTDCAAPAQGRGLCHKHYKRLTLYGSLDRLGKQPGRRSRLLDTALAALPTADCVHWTGHINDTGYAAGLRQGAAHGMPAHRLVYETVVGPIPDGLALDHLCHNADLTCEAGRSCLHRRCVNPEHLEPVSYKENDARARQRAQLVAAGKATS